MPAKWVIRKKWIKSELVLGEVRYSKATQRLRKLGLWKTVLLRNEQGRITGSSIQICDEIKTPNAGKTDDTVNLKARKSRVTYEVNTIKDPSDKEIKKRHAVGGYPSGSNLKKSDLTFSQEYGVVFSTSIGKIINEHRATAICLKFKMDAESVKKILAEFSAMIIRGDIKDPVASFVWLCKAQDSRQLKILVSSTPRSWAKIINPLGRNIRRTTPVKYNVWLNQPYNYI